VPQNDMLHGTLDALILKTLTWGPRHGYGIARWIEEATAEAVPVEEGSLYPALYRMERRGWISAEWGTSELGRKAKFYAITAQGRRQLAADTEQWARFAEAVSRVLLPFDRAQGKPESA
jgi:PadR family transcriptional regulator, regulatory protein PadR